MIVTLTVKIERNDHDGYCSGEENRYYSEITTINVELPVKYNTLPVGSIITDYDWSSKLTSLIPNINSGGSYYCENINAYGLDKHDYRLTVLTAVISE